MKNTGAKNEQNQNELFIFLSIYSNFQAVAEPQSHSFQQIGHLSSILPRPEPNLGTVPQKIIPPKTVTRPPKANTKPNNQIHHQIQLYFTVLKPQIS